MDDALLVRHLERPAQLLADGERHRDRQVPAARDQVLE